MTTGLPAIAPKTHPERRAPARFLVLQHVAHEGPGQLTGCFARGGVTLEVAELWRRQPIPAVEQYDALIVMGGPMGVNDSPEAYPTKKTELAAIERALTLDIPLLGICLGSQLLASALGARVYVNPGGKEIGVVRVRLTDAGNGLRGTDLHLKQEHLGHHGCPRLLEVERQGLAAEFELSLVGPCGQHSNFLQPELVPRLRQLLAASS